MNGFTMWTEDTLQGLYEGSDTLQWADVATTLDSVGSLDVLGASRFVMATLEAHAKGDQISYAFEKPWKFPEYWLPALAIYGRLYTASGDRLFSPSWDFDISDDYTFTLKVSELAE